MFGRWNWSNLESRTAIQQEYLCAPCTSIAHWHVSVVWAPTTGTKSLSSPSALQCLEHSSCRHISSEGMKGVHISEWMHLTVELGYEQRSDVSSFGILGKDEQRSTRDFHLGKARQGRQQRVPSVIREEGEDGSTDHCLQEQRQDSHVVFCKTSQYCKVAMILIAKMNSLYLCFYFPRFQLPKR